MPKLEILVHPPNYPQVVEEELNAYLSQEYQR